MGRVVKGGRDRHEQVRRGVLQCKLCTAQGVSARRPAVSAWDPCEEWERTARQKGDAAARHDHAAEQNRGEGENESNIHFALAHRVTASGSAFLVHRIARAHRAGAPRTRGGAFFAFRSERFRVPAPSAEKVLIRKNDSGTGHASERQMTRNGRSTPPAGPGWARRRRAGPRLARSAPPQASTEARHGRARRAQRPAGRGWGEPQVCVPGAAGIADADISLSRRCRRHGWRRARGRRWRGLPLLDGLNAGPPSGGGRGGLWAFAWLHVTRTRDAFVFR